MAALITSSCHAQQVTNHCPIHNSFPRHALQDTAPPTCTVLEPAQHMPAVSPSRAQRHLCSTHLHPQEQCSSSSNTCSRQNIAQHTGISNYCKMHHACIMLNGTFRALRTHVTLPTLTKAPICVLMMLHSLLQNQSPSGICRHNENSSHASFTLHTACWLVEAPQKQPAVTTVTVVMMYAMRGLNSFLQCRRCRRCLWCRLQ